MKLALLWAFIFPQALAVLITQDTVVEVTQTVTGLTGVGPPLAFSTTAASATTATTTTSSDSSTLQSTTTQKNAVEASASTTSASASTTSAYTATVTTAPSSISTISLTTPNPTASSSRILSATTAASTSAPSEKTTSTKTSIPLYGIVLICFGAVIVVIALLFAIWRYYHKLPRKSRRRRASVRSHPVSIIKKPLDAFDLTSLNDSMPPHPRLNDNGDNGNVPATAARSSMDMFSRSAPNWDGHHVHFAQGDGNHPVPTSSTSHPAEHQVFTAYNQEEIIAPKPTLPANAYQRQLTASFDGPYGQDDHHPLDASRHHLSPSPLRFVSMNGTSTPRLPGAPPGGGYGVGGARDHLTVPSAHPRHAGYDAVSTFHESEWEDIPVSDNNNDNVMLEPPTLRAYSPSNYSRHSGVEPDRGGGAYAPGTYQLPTRPVWPSGQASNNNNNHPRTVSGPNLANEKKWGIGERGNFF